MDGGQPTGCHIRSATDVWLCGSVHSNCVLAQSDRLCLRASGALHGVSSSCTYVLSDCAMDPELSALVLADCLVKKRNEAFA